VFNNKLKDSKCCDTSLHIMTSVWPNLQQCIWVSNDTFIPAVSGHCPKNSAIRTNSSRRMSELQSVLSLQKELWYPWLMFCILCTHLVYKYQYLMFMGPCIVNLPSSYCTTALSVWLWLPASWININNCPTRCNYAQFIIFL
jgi:hypothetical protein